MVVTTAGRGLARRFRDEGYTVQPAAEPYVLCLLAGAVLSPKFFRFGMNL